MSTSIVPYDDRFARRQAHTERPVPSIVTFPWGSSTVIINGEIKPLWKGVSVTLRMHGNAGGPMKIGWPNEKRFPNQTFGCLGCPYFGISVEYSNSYYCTHPLYLELFGAPQSSNNTRADPDCPMLGKRHERRQRSYRWHCKSHYIFWRYYDNGGENPYRHGFTFVYPSWR